MDGARIRYVFLDRDGVINRKLPEGYYVTEWAQFAWLPGAIEAIARMIRAGLMVFVVTNQRGVALQIYTIAQLEIIHNRMQTHLTQHEARLHAVFYCPHDEGVCQCRKPAGGMFEQAFREFPAANPQNSVMIGDSLSDIRAGRRMGMQTIFIQGEPARQKAGVATATVLADAVADSLLDAVNRHLGIPEPAS